MANTHVWKGPGSGSKGLVLRYDKPFDAVEHDYLDIEAMEEKGWAEPLKAAKKEERPYTPPPKADFNVSPEPVGKKKGK